MATTAETLQALFPSATVTPCAFVTAIETENGEYWVYPVEGGLRLAYADPQGDDDVLVQAGTLLLIVLSLVIAESDEPVVADLVARVLAG